MSDAELIQAQAEEAGQDRDVGAVDPRRLFKNADAHGGKVEQGVGESGTQSGGQQMPLTLMIDHLAARIDVELEGTNREFALNRLKMVKNLCQR